MSYKVDITVTNPDGQKATVSAAFEFTQAPTIAGISPSSGPDIGGTEAVITGTGFADGAVVQFGDKAAAGAVVSPDGTTITVTTPSMV
jgi:hypothetical protein